MFESKKAFLITILLAVTLNFEFRAVNELEKTHFGWYCSFSIDMNRSSRKRLKGYYDKAFSSIFINSEKIDEIRNQITDILEREDDNYENDSEDSGYSPDTSSDL